MSVLPRQLGLAISLREASRFSNFYVGGDVNREPVHYLQHLAENYVQSRDVDFVTLIWGSEGSGLSHLLQASCNRFVALGLHAQYLPLRDLLVHSPDSICEGLESYDLVVIDDIDTCGSNHAWQGALFNLFNRLKDAKKRLLLSAHHSPSELPIELLDLKSRLLSGTSFHIQTLDDDGLKAAFLERAAERGLELNEEVASFIFYRAPRSAKFAFGFLDQLDELSLAEKRKITIPFVRQVMESLR